MLGTICLFAVGCSLNLPTGSWKRVEPLMGADQTVVEINDVEYGQN